MAAIGRLVKYYTTTKAEKDEANATPMTPGFYGRFPTTLSLHYIQPGKDYKSQQFYLGQSTGDRMYAVTYHRGPGFYQMTLYSGPDHEPLSAPLAIAINEKRYSTSATIRLPAPEGSSASNIQSEQLKAHFGSDTYNFSLKVGRSSSIETLSDQYVDNFQWLEQRGKPAIRRLSRSKDKDKTVLATWTEGTVPGKDGKLATFRFTDGAREEFGEYWALMAVASALRICQSEWTALAGVEEFQKEKALEYNPEREAQKA